MKKNVKKNAAGNNDTTSEIRGEFTRHTTALMEHMTKEVKTVAEGHGIIIRKIDKIESDMAIIRPAVEAHSEDLKEIKSELHFVKMAVLTTSHEIKDHEKRIKRVEEKVLA